MDANHFQHACRRRSSHWVGLVLLVLLGSLPSQALAEARYAVGEISVIEGNPVKGVDAIFRHHFDTRCALTPVTHTGADFPIAGPIGSRVKLGVMVVGCDIDPTDVHTPSVTCSRRVGTRPRDEVTLELASHSEANWTYILPVDVPETIGTYDVELDCDIEVIDNPGDNPGVEAPPLVKTRMFATYAEPLLVVSPPEIDWYERATAWAEGIGKDDETGLVERLLDQAYEYGKANWRYGYSRLDDQNRYWFRGHNSRYRVQIGPDLDEVSQGEAKCHWKALLDPSSACNFADCYVFSRVLQFTAATLGVGGLINCSECNVVGEDSTGFLTSPEAQAIDDEFQRNVFCNDVSASLPLLSALQTRGETRADARCPAYFFRAHSILWRNDKYYDTTFKGIYDSPLGVIDVNVANGRNTVTLNDSSATLRRVDANPEVLYGDWELYSYLPDTNFRSSAPGQIGFTPSPVKFERIQLDDQPLVFEKLRATVEVNVGEPGVYSVWGYLSARKKHGEAAGNHVASRSQWSGVKGATAFVDADTRGPRRVELDFSGEEIYRAGINGPYELHAFLDGHGGEKKCMTDGIEQDCLTPDDYRFEQFGELDIEINRAEVTAGWSFADDDYGSLVVYVPLRVREKQPYVVQLALLQGETGIAYGGMKCEQLPCAPVATLRVPRSERFAGHGSYQLTAEVFSYPDLSSMDSYRLEIETPSQLIMQVSQK